MFSKFPLEKRTRAKMLMGIPWDTKPSASQVNKPSNDTSQKWESTFANVALSHKTNSYGNSTQLFGGGVPTTGPWSQHAFLPIATPFCGFNSCDGSREATTRKVFVEWSINTGTRRRIADGCLQHPRERNSICTRKRPFNSTSK